MNWDLVILVVAFVNLSILAIAGFSAAHRPGAVSVADYITIFNGALIGVILYRIIAQ